MVLHGALVQAGRRGLVVRNVAQLVDPPRMPRREMTAPRRRRGPSSRRPARGGRRHRSGNGDAQGRAARAALARPRPRAWHPGGHRDPPAHPGGPGHQQAEDGPVAAPGGALGLRRGCPAPSSQRADRAPAAGGPGVERRRPGVPEHPGPAAGWQPPALRAVPPLAEGRGCRSSASTTCATR
jgi:hypothetical protein